MQHWHILSAVGRDRPGLVAELARLVMDSDSNLEDSRMAILGSDFAAILLCSSTADDTAEKLAEGAKRLSRAHGLSVSHRTLTGEARPPVPAPGTRLYRVEAAGEDRAGIVAGICSVLAEHGVNIAELTTRSQPGPGGSPHYQMTIRAEVPTALDVRMLRRELEACADRLVLDFSLMPD